MASEVSPAGEAPERFERLHPSSLVFGVGRHARALLLPIVFVVFFARRSSWDAWIAVLFVPSAAFELYRYATTRYRLGATDLVVRRGLLFRSERNVPLDRIQNVDLVQNPLHRLLGVAEVRVETAAGASPEAVLNVLTLAAAERLRGDVMAGRGAAATGPAPPESGSGESGHEPRADAARDDSGAKRGAAPPAMAVHRIGTGLLVVLGLVSNRGMALVLVAIGVAWELDLFERVEVESIYREAMAHPGLFSLPALVAVAVLAMLALRVLSAAWAVLRFHGYVLELVGDDLRMRCGLITRVTATVPRRRVQVVSVRRTLLQRWLGCAAVRIETAGGTGGGDGDESRAVQSRRWFVPIVRDRDLGPVLEAIAPGLDSQLGAARWRPLSPRGRRRVLRMAAVVAVAAAALAGMISWLAGVWWIAAVGLAVAGLIALHAIREVRFMAHASAQRTLLHRSGAFTQQVSATFLDKIQVVSLHESPFDRRWGMVSLSVDTAGAGPAEHPAHIPCLEADEGRRLLTELIEHAEAVAAGPAPPVHGETGLATCRAEAAALS